MYSNFCPILSGLQWPCRKGHPDLKATMKKLTKGSLEEKGTLEEGVMQFLFKYRITPQSITGQSPSDLLFRH